MIKNYGETGRAFNTWKKEHLRNTKTAAKGSRIIANHAWSNNHAIDFENASVIEKGTFRTRKTLEAWHTRVTPYADNNTTFFLTNIHNHLHFYFAIHAFYSNFLIAFLSLILPVEDCSSGSRKLIVFNHFSQRSFFKFQLRIIIVALGVHGWPQWWKHSPPTNAARVWFPDSASHVGRVCWFSSLLWKVFLQIFQFSPPLKNQTFIWFALIH